MVTKYAAEVRVKWWTWQVAWGCFITTTMALAGACNAWGHASGWVLAGFAIAFLCGLAGMVVDRALESAKRQAIEMAVATVATECLKWQNRAMDIKQAVEAAGVEREVLRRMKEYRELGPGQARA